MIWLVYAVVAAMVVLLPLRLMRDNVMRQHNPAAQAHWLWAAAQPPDSYLAQLSLFLRMQGWRIVSAEIGPLGRPELVLRRDRWRVALLCAGPQQPPVADADATRLVTLAQQSGATRAAIVSTAPGTGGAGLSQGAAPMRLRFDDLAYLDVSVGLAG